MRVNFSAMAAKIGPSCSGAQTVRETPHAGADQVVTVSAAYPLRGGNKRESDAGRCAEERQCKQQIEDEKVQKLPRFPDHGERIERQPLGHGKAGDGRHRE